MTLERSRGNEDRTNEMRDTRVSTEVKSLQKPLEKALEDCRYASQLSDMAHSVVDAAVIAFSALTSFLNGEAAHLLSSAAQFIAGTATHSSPAPTTLEIGDAVGRGGGRRDQGGRGNRAERSSRGGCFGCGNPEHRAHWSAKDLRERHTARSNSTRDAPASAQTAASSPVVVLAQPSSDADIARRLQELTAALSSRHAQRRPQAQVYAAALAQQEREEQLDAMFRPSAFAIMPDLVLYLRGDGTARHLVASAQTGPHTPGCRHTSPSTPCCEEGPGSGWIVTSQSCPARAFFAASRRAAQVRHHPAHSTQATMPPAPSATQRTLWTGYATASSTAPAFSIALLGSYRQRQERTGISILDTGATLGMVRKRLTWWQAPCAKSTWTLPA
ncbi:hypothetical protein T492DRAFT_1134074 [Pavlovales sp. CCMP2436]|nr:hypothetical protein T492DRAFT_1134074 [Pavlovales sp. CCMP2436]